jgi:drug/metabolite transporter superfamily protein YnfA
MAVKLICRLYGKQSIKPIPRHQGPRNSRKGSNLVILKIITLLVAAILEVGGDALIRAGLRGTYAWLAAGAVTLFAYGVTVNQSPLDFGRLMGAYIAVFFVVSQVIAAAVFHQPPSRSTLAGGVLIVAGGFILLI